MVEMIFFLVPFLPILTRLCELVDFVHFLSSRRISGSSEQKKRMEDHCHDTGCRIEPFRRGVFPIEFCNVRK